MKTFLTILFFISAAHAGPLMDKSNVFDRRADASKVNYGLIGNSDDTPIWTGVYIAAMAYRYRATHDTQALEKMEESLRGFVTLHEITGIPGFIARKIDKLSAPLPDGFQPASGKFQGLMWKGKVSFDQYMGYLYGISEAWPYIQDKQLREDVRSVISSIGHHFLDHKEKIQGPGTDLNFSSGFNENEPLPREVSGIRAIFFIRGGRAMYALHLIKVASLITQEAVFQNYYHYLIYEKNYAAIVRDFTQGHTEKMIKDNLGIINAFAKVRVGTAVKATPESLRSDVAQNLGHIVGYSIAHLEEDPKIKPYFVEGLRRCHEPVSRESNTYWNFLYSKVSNTDPQGIADGIESLRHFPMDNYGQRSNSGDPKIPKYKGLSANFFKGAKWKFYSVNPLPIEKRPMHSFAWQQNAHEMDGNYGNTDAPGVAYLVAYWLGREQGWISDNE